MEQLIELLQQIQDLAGAGIDALKGAKDGGKQPPEREPGAAPGGMHEGMHGGGGAPPPEKGAPPA